VRGASNTGHNFTQSAILPPVAGLNAPGLKAAEDTLTLSVFVDGGLIEAYTSGAVITPLINPVVASGGAPDARVSTFVNTATGVTCKVESYKLAY
jgi:hypothetical protein